MIAKMSETDQPSLSMKFSTANISAMLTAVAVLINAAASTWSAIASSAPNRGVAAVYVIVAFVSMAALWFQYRASQAYIVAIDDPSKWREREIEGAELIIPAGTHKKGVGARVSVEVTTPEGDFELVETDLRARPNGDVKIIVGRYPVEFTGRIVIV